jgi:hypothetical protein
MDRRRTICAIRCSYATRGGDQYLTKFHETALGNPALRALLWRAGPELGDDRHFRSLQAAPTSARNECMCEMANSRLDQSDMLFIADN